MSCFHVKMNTAYIFFFSYFPSVIVIHASQRDSECVRPGRGQPGFLISLASNAAPLNVMAGWWETQLQGAPGWLALRGDVIAGCTRLIDRPCCSVARDDGHEARSCTAATASCSPLLLPPSLLFLNYFTLFLTPFILFLFPSPSLNLSIMSLYFLFLFQPLLSLSLVLSSWLASPGLLLSAGAAALLSVRECCWVSFEEGRNPECLGSLSR